MACWIKRYSFWFFVFASIIVAVVSLNAADIALFSCVPVTRADAALVLGSSVYGGSPSPIFKGRLDTAVDLYKHEVVYSILISGGATREGEPSEAYAGAQYVVGQGVSGTDVILESEARSTQDNLRFGASELARRGLKSWVVVSDPYHLRRAQMLVEDQGMAFQCVAVPHSSRNSISFLFDESRKLLLIRIARMVRWIAPPGKN